jgi:hypothetical protein
MAVLGAPPEGETSTASGYGIGLRPDEVAALDQVRYRRRITSRSSTASISFTRAAAEALPHGLPEWPGLDVAGVVLVEAK